MTVLAFCKIHAGEIYTIDLSKGLQPELIYKASFYPVDLNRFAYAPGGTIYFLSMYNANRIFVTKAHAKTEELFYAHPTPITNVRVRGIGQDPLKHRVFFSASLEPNTWTNSETIYYLNDQNQAVPYHTYSGEDLPIPDPCDPGPDNYTYWLGWPGNFCFDDKDNIYLGTGATIPGGIYKATGATESGVTGSPQEIITSLEHVFGNLAYEAPNSLYFTRHGPAVYTINRLDFSPLKVTDPLYSTQPGYDSDPITDVAVVPVLVKPQFRPPLAVSAQPARVTRPTIMLRRKVE